MSLPDCAAALRKSNEFNQILCSEGVKKLYKVEHLKQSMVFTAESPVPSPPTPTTQTVYEVPKLHSRSCEPVRIYETYAEPKKVMYQTTTSDWSNRKALSITEYNQRQFKRRRVPRNLVRRRAPPNFLFRARNPAESLRSKLQLFQDLIPFERN